MARVLKAAAERTPDVLKRDVSMSARVYLPRFLRGSATSKRTTRYATRNPMER
jgi:hypothetical protein